MVFKYVKKSHYYRCSYRPNPVRDISNILLEITTTITNTNIKMNKVILTTSVELTAFAKRGVFVRVEVKELRT